MSTTTFDGQSFIIDGRRIWLVSGAIHYPRVPRALWGDRIRAAKQAGLNCIETYVFWNAHEPEPGRFVFEDNLDLRAFVQMVAEEGMWCILRPGPYVCAEWDFGGLPPWLGRITGSDEPPVKLRQSDPRFLEACARYLGAVMRQVRDLQVTTPTEGLPVSPGVGNVPGRPAGGFTGGGRGPIVLMQAENEWFCHNAEQAQTYLREIVRYLMENGCEVPIINCNNLWQRMEGTIDTWNANRNLLADLRQLAFVQPEAPRLVSEYWPGWFDNWGGKHADAISAELHLYRLSQILAAGGQYNLYMFHGGTNFAFTGGRNTPRGDGFQTTSYDYDAPLHEAGGRGAKFDATKRISTFASQFAHVLAHLNEPPPPCAVAVDETRNHPISLVHVAGTQGEVLFLFKSESDKRKQVDVLLPSGLTLPVPLEAGERVAWCLLNTSLGGLAELEHTNLQPWAFIGRRMLVLFGPAGADGLVNIDDVPIEVQVPTGKEPRIEYYESLSLVVLNTEQVDAAYIDAKGLILGAAGLDARGDPIRRPGWSRLYRVALDGKLTTESMPTVRAPTAPRLTQWRHAPLDTLLDGSDKAFRKIDGPMSLERLECDYGYGWYRIGVGSAKSGRMLAPQAGDRLHIYNDGKFQALLGVGPGATDESAQMRLSGDVVVLADNLGRPKVHVYEPQLKGLFGHLLNVRQARLAKPKVETVPLADPFALSGYMPMTHRDTERVGSAEALIWQIKPSGRQPCVFDLGELPLPGVVSVNGEPMAHHHPRLYQGPTRLVLTPGEGGFTGGTNEIRLTLLEPMDKRVNVEKYVHLYQSSGAVTGRGQWAFCPWAAPSDEAFGELPAPSQKLPSQPAWFRAAFKVHDASVPLWLEPRGMSKGQIYLNGHNVGRYFMATRDGKAVGPQEHYYLPEPWLRTDAANELLLFDEHGRDPRKCRLLYNRMGPYQSEPRGR